MQYAHVLNTTATITDVLFVAYAINFVVCVCAYIMHIFNIC